MRSSRSISERRPAAFRGWNHEWTIAEPALTTAAISSHTFLRNLISDLIQGQFRFFGGNGDAVDGFSHSGQDCLIRGRPNVAHGVQRAAGGCRSGVFDIDAHFLRTLDGAAKQAGGSRLEIAS